MVGKVLWRQIKMNPVDSQHNSTNQTK